MVIFYFVSCLSAGARKITGLAGYPTPPTQIWLDEVSCVGTETNIDLCSHQPWGTHNCGHSEDVGVSCSNSEYRLWTCVRACVRACV